MRHLTLPGLLMLAFSVSAFGDIMPPNAGNCAAPATASTCSGQPQIDLFSGMSFDIASNDADDSSRHVSDGLGQGTLIGFEHVNNGRHLGWRHKDDDDSGAVIPSSVPDGGMTFMLLAGAFIGLEALRRRVGA